MTKLERELEHLRQADGHIASAQARIAHLEDALVRDTASGADTQVEALMLATARDGLDSFVAHRVLIVSTIDDIRAGRLPNS